MKEVQGLFLDFLNLTLILNTTGHTQRIISYQITASSLEGLHPIDSYDLSPQEHLCWAQFPWKDISIEVDLDAKCIKTVLVFCCPLAGDHRQGTITNTNFEVNLTGVMNRLPYKK